MRPPRRILVVDDTTEVRTLVCRILEGEGYDVLEMSDATNAISACQEMEGKIDLLVTDIKMPGMDGVELARQLTSAYPLIKVLFISGQCEEAEVPTHMDKGFGFLSKPFMPHVLLAAVENALAATKRPPNSEFGPPNERERTG
jgi:CheY-like chemotaxis protein